jgi:hypothetical protein
MARKKRVTASMSKKRFTLEEITLVIEAISVFKDANRRMSTGLFDKDGRIFSERRRQALAPDELMELMSDGEVEIRNIPMGPKFTPEEHEMLDDLWDGFVAGLAKIEETIEENINTEVEESIGGVIDDLYTMLKSEKQ